MQVSQLIAIGLLAAMAVGWADVIKYTDSTGSDPTDWSKYFLPPQFNPALGTLDSIDVYLRSDLEGRGQVENLDASAATVNINLQAKITLLRPDLTPLVTVLPTVSRSFDASAFDGIVDFGGTSGFDTGVVTDRDVEKQSYDDSADLALFTGLGEVHMPVVGTGQSSVTGAGSVDKLLTTQADTYIEIYYNYTPHTTAVPEGGTMLTLLGGAVFLVAVCRQKKL